jgi:hypothetical protein
MDKMPENIDFDAEFKKIATHPANEQFFDKAERTLLAHEALDTELDEEMYRALEERELVNQRALDEQLGDVPEATELDEVVRKEVKRLRAEYLDLSPSERLEMVQILIGTLNTRKVDEWQAQAFREFINSLGQEHSEKGEKHE